jgi:hypothetical protein
LEPRSDRDSSSSSPRWNQRRLCCGIHGDTRKPSRSATGRGFSDENRAFEIAPRGYIQLDWRGFPEWPVTPGTGRLGYDTFEVRRARIGVDGRVRRVSFELSVDPEDDDDGTLLKDAYGQMRFSRAIRLRVGQFKIPEDVNTRRQPDRLTSWNDRRYPRPSLPAAILARCSLERSVGRSTTRQVCLPAMGAGVAHVQAAPRRVA